MIMKKIFLLLLCLFSSLCFLSFSNKVDNGYIVYLSDLKNINPLWSVEEVYDYYDRCTVNNQISPISEQYEIFGNTLTADELRLIAEHPFYSNKAYKCATKALSDTKDYFPNNSSDGDFGNAFQHCYWTMLLCLETNPNFALEFTTAHENYDSNNKLHKNMDLTNNRVAYEYFLNNNINSESKCVLSSLTLLNNTKLTYIIFNYRYLKQVNIVIGSNIRREIYAYGDFYAYTTETVPYNLPDVIYSYKDKDIIGPSI